MPRVYLSLPLSSRLQLLTFPFSFLSSSIHFHAALHLYPYPGDFSLRISPVTLEDDSYFQCQVTGWKDIPGVRSQTAKLTVYVPPEPPEIIQGPVVTTTAGAGVQLTCISKGGKPAAEVSASKSLPH